MTDLDEQHRDFWCDRNRLQRIEEVLRLVESPSIAAAMPPDERAAALADLREAVRLAPIGGPRSAGQVRKEEAKRRKAEGEAKAESIFVCLKAMAETSGVEPDTVARKRVCARFGITGVSYYNTVIKKGQKLYEERQVREMHEAIGASLREANNICVD